MRLTVYADYILWVMTYLALKHPDGGVATIDDIAGAYGISRNYLTKIIHELSQGGLIETTRGRAGGARLGRALEKISVGEIVRVAKKDLAVVRYRDMNVAHDYAIFPACNLRRRLYRAVDAFLHELANMTLRKAIATPTVAATVLGIANHRELVPVPVSHPRGRTSRCAGDRQ